MVLEAMKMENEIKAPRDAVIKVVHVEAGKSVETQEPLLTLE
jgi:biotin carboxyl carrier protein